MIVELTIAEREHALAVGRARTLLSRQRGYRNYNGGERRQDQFNQIGALGERAAAKALNREWLATVAPGYDGDLDGGIEVRTHESPYPVERSYLLLHPNDVDNRPYVLVDPLDRPALTATRFDLRGWINGADGKVEDYWGDRFNTGFPCYWIPAVDLHDPALLIASD